MMPRRRTRWACCALATIGVALAGCATIGSEQPVPTDKVQTAEAAIAIARRACGAGDGETKSEAEWKATLRLGKWDVEHVDPALKSQCFERVKVRADDGKAERCEACVFVT